jgi:hypothetical protein
MNALKMITDSPFLVVNKELARKLGIDAALIFAELASSQKYYVNDGIEEWFFRTGQQLQELTTLSAKVQRKQIDVLKAVGILKTSLKGMPAIIHFKIDNECLLNLLQLCPNSQTSYAQKAQQVFTKTPTSKKERIRNISLLDLPDSISEEFKTAIIRYFDYREEIGKKFKSDKSISTKINEFIQQAEKYSEKAVLESIETAIGNGWQGTFIDKKYLHTSQTSKQYGTASAKISGKESIANFIQNASAFELD